MRTWVTNRPTKLTLRELSLISEPPLLSEIEFQTKITTRDIQPVLNYISSSKGCLQLLSKFIRGKRNCFCVWVQEFLESFLLTEYTWSIFFCSVQFKPNQTLNCINVTKCLSNKVFAPIASDIICSKWGTGLKYKPVYKLQMIDNVTYFKVYVGTGN